MKLSKFDCSSVKMYEYITAAHMVLGRGGPVISDEELFYLFKYVLKRGFNQNITIDVFNQITNLMENDKNKYFVFTKKGMEFTDPENFVDTLTNFLAKDLNKDLYLTLADWCCTFACEHPEYEKDYVAFKEGEGKSQEGAKLKKKPAKKNKGGK